MSYVKTINRIFRSAGDKEPIGKYVSKSVMYEEVLKSIDRIKKVIDRSEKEVYVCGKFRVCTCGYQVSRNYQEEEI